MLKEEVQTNMPFDLQGKIETDPTLMNFIICGSRKYENINFDRLVDSFDTIVRHNMLLPNNNYGKRNSDFQVLNCHIAQYHAQQIDLSKWIAVYAKEFLITKAHMGSFYEYLKLDTVKFQNFENNNTSLMNRVLSKHGIEHTIKKQIRCGIGSIAACIDGGIKPFLIGFGLQKESLLNKQFTDKEGTGQCHDVCSEAELIKKLHKADLVDATFCAIEDTQDVKIDSSLLVPTTVSLDILKRKRRINAK